MKLLIAILFLCSLAFIGAAQTEVTQDTLHFKEAPDDLKKLIEEISATKEKVSSDADIEIDGLLFDETKTKSGRDFYDFFYTAWEAPKGARNYFIYISEKPYRLSTTMIEIRINETLVFQSFLQPRNEIVEQLAQQAVARTQVYLANYEELVRQLDGEDRSGTGIF
ncbi:CsgE family curli-type amyloid fiber assembly protein [uncultured Draconibacterium sp.]|uniref:CsgE family curli-type amyloid fiber assembly protein n=1 Tax=uncultured Draconibacterium sp. TaxID=1573823 RepID=UPI002AA75BA1|nr:CsgE family curli-type amyloid fiber assembly protein [uncultured Draconibacterium sp.]